MEPENLEAGLTKLAEEIEQMEARIDARLASLRDEIKAEIRSVYFAQIRDMSLTEVEMLRRTTDTPSLAEACARAYNEIIGLAEEYKNHPEKDLAEFQNEINNASDTAGIGRIWEV